MFKQSLNLKLLSFHELALVLINPLHAVVDHPQDLRHLWQNFQTQTFENRVDQYESTQGWSYSSSSCTSGILLIQTCTSSNNYKLVS